MPSSRKTIIVGNGLGLALDSKYFTLDAAVRSVWDSDCLSATQKDLIIQCTSVDGSQGPPVSENHLDTLQNAQIACDFLGMLGMGGQHWLSEDGLEFSDATRKFTFEVAKYFHMYPNGLENEFLNPLSNFLHTTYSNIAVLNYDGLLYLGLQNKGIFQPLYQDTFLVDGFLNKGFSEQHLRRTYNKFGYYMHLHGSPLFITNPGRCIVKMSRSSLLASSDVILNHIVLTHIRHKPMLISSSDLLSTYWKFLIQAINESNELLLFGYSGEDAHLNEVIRSHAADINIRIVEWDGAGIYSDRADYWNKKLLGNCQLIHLPNILSFTSWTG